MANILNEMYFDLNNWTKNMTSFPVFQNEFTDGINTLNYQGGGGYERLYIPITLQKNWEYTFRFKMHSPTGFQIGDYGNNSAFAFIRTSAPSDTGGALSYTNFAYSQNWENASSDEPVQYSISFNSGNYTTLYLALDFGYIMDGVTCTYIFSDFELDDGIFVPDLYYLIRNETGIYTITDGMLSLLSDAEVTTHLFQTYGVKSINDTSILLELTNPELMCWTPTEDYLPSINATLIATPKPQTIITDTINLTHYSITGIESATVTCEGNIVFAVSFDNKATWKSWNGTEWSTVSEDTSGMTKELFESITYNQWLLLFEVASSFYIRASLLDTTAKLTQVYIDFAN